MPSSPEPCVRVAPFLWPSLSATIVLSPDGLTRRREIAHLTKVAYAWRWTAEMPGGGLGAAKFGRRAVFSRWHVASTHASARHQLAAGRFEALARWLLRLRARL